jgi:hypothetical protein
MGSFQVARPTVEPIQQPDVQGNLVRLQQLRGMQQQQQYAQQEQPYRQQIMQEQATQAPLMTRQVQLENQQRQQSMQDVQKLQALSPQFVQKDPNGKIIGYDYDGLFSAAQAGGVSPTTLGPLQKSIADGIIAKSNATKLQRENEATVNQQAFEHVEGLRGTQDPNQRQQIWTSTLQWAQQNQKTLASLGIDPTKLPQQAPDDNALNGIEAGLGMHAQQLKDSTDRADLASKKATAAKTEAENAYYAANGGAPGVPVESQELNSYLKAHPGSTAADFAAWKAKLAPQAQFSFLNATGMGKDPAAVAKQFGMTQTAFDQAAEKYWTSGVLPPSGRGGPALAMNKALMNRAGELHPQGSLAENSAEFKANQASLQKLQTNFDQVQAFEQTAKKNMDLLQQTMKGIPDLGARFLNVPARMITGNMIGTENMARFKTALNVAQTEAAKVLNSSTGTGILSDSARHELQQIIDGSLPLGAMVASLDTLRSDMDNRTAAYNEQIGDIKGRLSGAAKPPGGGQTQGAPLTITLPSGKKVTIE